MPNRSAVVLSSEETLHRVCDIRHGRTAESAWQPPCISGIVWTFAINCRYSAGFLLKSLRFAQIAHGYRKAPEVVPPCK